jgi:hypothetical protein
LTGQPAERVLLLLPPVPDSEVDQRFLVALTDAAEAAPVAPAVTRGPHSAHRDVRPFLGPGPLVLNDTTPDDVAVVERRW